MVTPLEAWWTEYHIAAAPLVAAEARFDESRDVDPRAWYAAGVALGPPAKALAEWLEENPGPDPGRGLLGLAAASRYSELADLFAKHGQDDDGSYFTARYDELIAELVTIGRLGAAGSN
jgi:hypothetical protein